MLFSMSNAVIVIIFDIRFSCFLYIETCFSLFILSSPQHYSPVQMAVLSVN